MNCIIHDSSPAEYHYLKTRKAHPELKDKDFNKIPCCSYCHRMFHDRGTNYMARTHYRVLNWLLKHGWYYDDVLLRWECPK